MKAQEYFDIEEEVLEDPIKIVETDKFIDNQSVEAENKNFGYMSKVGKSSRVELKQNSESNICQSSKPLIQTFERNYEIKQAIVKLIDCYKYPWCYAKYTEQYLKKRKELIKEINSKRRKTKISNMQPNEIKPDNQCENNKQENPKVISDISVKIKYDSNKKVWIVENKQDRLMNKNDIELRKAINQRNVDMIDFKRNTGLVGLTVKQKLIVTGENITPTVKKASIEKPIPIERKNRTILGEVKYSSHGKNKKDIKCRNSQSKRTTEPKKCKIQNKKTELNYEDSNTQTVNLTRNTKINHEEMSNQLVSNYTQNCSKASISQNDSGSQNPLTEKRLDKPQTLKPTTNIIYNRPAPKCKKVIQKKPEINADNNKTSDKTVQNPNAYNASSLVELDCNKPVPESNGVVKEMSKINIVKISSREQRSANFSFRLPNCNDQYKGLPTAYANGISQMRHRLPVHRPPPMNRFNLYHNLSYQRYNSPPLIKRISWHQNLYSYHNNYSFNSVYRPQARFTRPPPPRYPFDVPPFRRPPAYNANVCPLHSSSYNNISSVENMNKVFIPTFRKNFELTKNNTIHSYNSNGLIPINSQGTTTIGQNNIKKATEVETDKPLVNNNSDSLKRSCITDNNIIKPVDQKSEPLTKKIKLEKLPKLETEVVSKTKRETSITEYSPPILPIPSHETILSLLRSRDMVSVKTKYLRNSYEDTDSPNYVDTQHKYIKHESDTENDNSHKLMKNESDTESVLISRNISNVKKISLLEYKRRASLK